MKNIGGPLTTKQVILYRLSESHTNNENRYFYTDKYGWVDIRHFARAAAMAMDYSRTFVEILGFANEVVQWLTEWGDDYRSGFSPEDLPSNSAGSDFGKNYARKNIPLDQAFDEWLNSVGGRRQEDPKACKQLLPLTDPSVKGGSGGSSQIGSNPKPINPEEIRRREELERWNREMLRRFPAKF